MPNRSRASTSRCLAGVPDRDREHPAQVLCEAVPISLVEMCDDLGVPVGAEGMPVAERCSAQRARSCRSLRSGRHAPCRPRSESGWSPDSRSMIERRRAASANCPSRRRRPSQGRGERAVSTSAPPLAGCCTGQRYDTRDPAHGATLVGGAAVVPIVCPRRCGSRGLATNRDGRLQDPPHGCERGREVEPHGAVGDPLEVVCELLVPSRRAVDPDRARPVRPGRTVSRCQY